jgi:hypothetical protein
MFIVQASFTIVTYDRQNIFIVQAIGVCEQGRSLSEWSSSFMLFSVASTYVRLEKKCKKHSSFFKSCHKGIMQF